MTRRSSRKSTKRKRGVDPADVTFFSNLFASIAEEMGVTLARTAFSPNIKERRDFSCAVFDGKGRMLAQAAHIPVHLGALPMSVEAVRNAFPKLQAGDAVIANDPYAGGTHLPDITMVTPFFAGSRARTPFALLVTRAHHADVGGIAPGSLPLATDIYQEGLRIPPVKLFSRGTLNHALLEVLNANVRTPEERQGDLRAQRAAHDVGAKRLREAVEKYTLAKLQEQTDTLIRYGRRLMESLIRKIPDGCYRFEDRLDDDGVSSSPLPIRVRLTIKGARAEVDFGNSAAGCRGSMNAVGSVTRSAVYYCFLCLLSTPSPLLDKAFEEPPLNAGCLEPITVVAPEGSIVNARAPAAVAGGNVETSQRIVDVVLGALAQALPDLIPAASQGTMNNLTLGGRDTRSQRPFAYYETIGGGVGGAPDRDGLDGLQVHMTNTMNTPIEALEFAYPLRVERYAIARKTGGRGKRCGGNGLLRDVRVLAEAHGSLLTERRERGPYGLQGGEAGKPGKNVLIRRDRKKSLPGKTLLQLAPGDVVSIRTPGGGGWGRPPPTRRS